MSSLTRYALWLAPEEAASGPLQLVINELASRYSGPIFSPHMTLLGWAKGEEEALIAKTESLASTLAPIDVNLTGFAGAPYYFRCFFAPLDSSGELRHAVNEASSIFDASAGTNYQPHISLLYGQLDREEKKSIPGQIGDKVPRTFSLDSVQLVRMSVSVSGWVAVAESPLTGS